MNVCVEINSKNVMRYHRVKAAVNAAAALFNAPDRATFWEERFAAIERLKAVLNEQPGQERPEP